MYGAVTEPLMVPALAQCYASQHWVVEHGGLYNTFCMEYIIMNECCRKAPSTIMVHCRMLENTAQAQQESLGILGVNLIHGALTSHKHPNAILSVSQSFIAFLYC